MLGYSTFVWMFRENQILQYFQAIEILVISKSFHYPEVKHPMEINKQPIQVEVSSIYIIGHGWPPCLLMGQLQYSIFVRHGGPYYMLGYLHLFGCFLEIKFFNTCRLCLIFIKKLKENTTKRKSTQRLLR